MRWTQRSVTEWTLFAWVVIILAVVIIKLAGIGLALITTSER